MIVTGQTSVELLAAVAAVQRQFIAAADPHQAFDEALQLLLQLSGSEFGVIGEVLLGDEGRPFLKTYAISNISWDDASQSFYDAYALVGLEFHNLANLLGEVMLTAKPVISNDPANDRRSGGVPKGHPPLRSFLGMPFFGSGSELVGMVGLANRPDGYDDELATTLEPLCDSLGLMIVAAQRERRRHETEDALRQSEARYRTFVDHVTDGLFLHGEDGRVVDVNRQACERMGYTRDELIGMSPMDFDPDITQADLDHNMSRLARGESIALDTRHQRKDGSKFPVEVRIRPLWVEGQLFALALACDITERKRTEEALLETQRRLDLILRGADVGLWDWDLVTNQVMFSREWKSQLGYAEHEIAGCYEDFRSRVHPDDLELTLSNVQKAIDACSDDYDAEFRMQHKDGSWRWLLARGFVIAGADRRPVQMLGVHIGIDERKRAEEALRESGNQLAEAQRLAHVGSWTWDLRSNAVAWSEELYRIWGVDPTEFAGTFEASREFIHPDDIKFVDRMFAEALHARKPYVIEHRIVHPNGVVRSIQARGIFVFDKAGDPVSAFGTVQDITERKQTEDALRESEARLRTLLENLDKVAVQAYEPDGTITFWNKASEMFYGYTAEEALGRDLVELLHSEKTRDEERRIMAEALCASESLAAEEVDVVRNDGSKITVFASRIVHPRPGKEPEFFCFDVDITDRKRAEEELAIRQAELLHASRLTTVGRMVADLSHEVAQPLTAIGNFAAASAEILETKPEGQLDRLHGYVREIAKQNERCGAILQRMRDFSRRTSAPRTSCDVARLLRDSVDLIANDLRRYHVRVQCQLPSKLPPVQCDRVQFEQVVVNLLTNARDAVHGLPNERRVISIRAFADQEAVVFEVEDHGQGISTDAAARLFEPFFTTKEHGMGLGLSICDSIVKDHGGQMKALPNSAGGATFRVSLPIHEEQGRG